MNRFSIQIQSLLYENDKSEIEKSLSSIGNALRVAVENDIFFSKVVISIGDSSSNPIFAEADIEKIKQKFSKDVEIYYEFFGFNTGYGKGHNLLAKSSDVDYLMIINPDVILSTMFFKYMLYPLKNKNIGIVEARQTPVEHQKEYDKKTFFTDWATGACIIIRNDLFKSVDGFDESFFMYCEDVDLSWKVRLKGYSIYYQPLAPVFHSKYLSKDGKWQPTETEIYYSIQSALLLAYKWSEEEYYNKLYEGYKNNPDKVYKDAVEVIKYKIKSKSIKKVENVNRKIVTFLDGYYSENRFVL